MDRNGGTRQIVPINTTDTIYEALNQADCLTHSTLSKQPQYDANDSRQGKRLSSSTRRLTLPSPRRPLRSTIIGAFLANMYKACGSEVVSLNGIQACCHWYVITNTLLILVVSLG